MARKVHDSLGVSIEHSEAGKVKLTTVDYVEKVLSELPKDMDGITATPVALHLFKVSGNPEWLDERVEDFFHWKIVKLLFACKHAHPNLQSTVRFLSPHG
jgi:hypothetical protein